MIQKVLTTGLLFLAAVQAQTQGSCKEPYVEERLLADDVRFASPFYVIALPRTPRTEEMDNVCYTYFEDKGEFLHIMSITFKNGTNQFYIYNKHDISDRLGLAVATAKETSSCVFHDYTLRPVCGFTVFILYRCFRDGDCSTIDIGITQGVDVRVVLAANPKISAECQKETTLDLKNTSILNGDDYVFLPQNRKPQCITKYNSDYSLGHDRAVGSKEVTDGDVAERFGNNPTDDLMTPPQVAQAPVTAQPTQANWGHQTMPPRQPVKTSNRNPYNPYGTNLGKPTNGYNGMPQTSPRPGYSPPPAWTQNNGQWNQGPSPWGGQTVRPGAENHFHMWQSPASTVPPKTSTGKTPNVFYHIHTWENPPPGCCRCN